MRIVVDLQAAQGPSRYRGIGRYALALTSGLARNRGKSEVFVALNGMLPDSIVAIREALAGLVPAENFIVWNACGPVNAANSRNDARRRAAELVRESALASVAPDFILITSLFEGFEENIVTSIGSLSTKLNTAAIIFDLIPLIYKEKYLSDHKLEKWYNNKIGHARNANLLLAISESSRWEALTFLGANALEVVNISAAADAHFTPGAVSAEDRVRLAKEFGLKRPYVMYTGGIEQRKNIERLIEAYARLPRPVRARHQLAIVCAIKDQDLEQLMDLAKQAGLASDELIATGYITDDDLLTCYRACKLFVFPSWHEGFGLPALEAMRCGRAVLVSDRAGLPEVVGLKSATFDPFDIDMMSEKMHDVLIDDDLRRALECHGLERAKEFDWDKTARSAWEALQASHARHHHASVSSLSKAQRRPRLAFVSPLAPENSGISDYSAELLPELARHYRIEVITKTGRASDPWVLGNCPVRDVSWFDRHAHEFDRILYQFGNSEFHSHMFELLHVHPGVIVLHDFFLSGVLRYLDATDEKPGAWIRALVDSHGWYAAAKLGRVDELNDILWSYPCNSAVLQDSLGVIVHADYSKQLARNWYGESTPRDWHLIRHLRQPIAVRPQADVRQQLGMALDDFIVCSFGVVGQTKMSHRLLEAWQASPLANDPQCRLIFVGQNDGGDYCRALERKIRTDPCGGRIEMVGWTDQSRFRRWLGAADVAVQLRTLSRGETSGTVLDCMNAGIATIVNAHGSMAELPPDAVWMLDDEFATTDLVAALATLRRDRNFRQALGARGKEHVAQNHNPRQCADAYYEAIEEAYARAATGRYGLARALSEIDLPLTQSDWTAIARGLAHNQPLVPRAKRILVDVSVLSRLDARSGIQRVVRSILWHWLTQPRKDCIVEPVRGDPSNQCYRHARIFTCNFLGIAEGWCDDEVVEACSGDVFVGLDFDPHTLPLHLPVLEEWRRGGVRIEFVVYDLLPILMPQHFPPDANESHQRWLESISKFDAVTCISRAVADELIEWLGKNAQSRPRPLAINWIHLGADIKTTFGNGDQPDGAKELLALLREAPSFLVVGTIEPRKGLRQVLAAFDLLWGQGVGVRLVLVGKMGWMMEDFAQRLKEHPQFGGQLIWLEGVSDQLLASVYGACSFLIAASEGEGFGLPLVEAARYGLKVLARDIPVFREVAVTENYFPNSNDPQILANSIEKVLSGSSSSTTSDSVDWRSWENVAHDLLTILISELRPYRWWRGSHDLDWQR